MSAVYARVPDASDDLGGSVVGRLEWSVADRPCAHGRQVHWRRMHPDQDTNRGGSQAEGSVALRAVLRRRQVLPQYGKGLSGRYSARCRERFTAQPVGSPECSTAKRRERQRCPGSGSQNPEPAKPAREPAEGNSYSRAENRNCPNRAHGKLRGPGASARDRLRNRQPGQPPRLPASRIRCSSTGPTPDETSSKRKGIWQGEETYATQMARTTLAQ